jgi:hypothetical protein
MSGFVWRILPSAFVIFGIAVTAACISLLAQKPAGSACNQAKLPKSMPNPRIPTPWSAVGSSEIVSSGGIARNTISHAAVRWWSSVMASPIRRRSTPAAPRPSARAAPMMVRKILGGDHAPTVGRGGGR